MSIKLRFFNSSSCNSHCYSINLYSVDRNIGDFREIWNEFIIFVIVDIEYVIDAGGAKDFHTIDTGVMSYICGSSFGTNPSLSTIGDGILFSMNGGLFMAMANFRFVGTTWEKPIVSLGDDPIIFN